MVKLYVEGGGDINTLKTECRKGFRSFLEKAGLDGALPRIVVSGSRQNAFRDFCTAVKNKKEKDYIFLLVDSEKTVESSYKNGEPADWQPWKFLEQKEQWQKPEQATDSQCHLMAVCMETWLLADTETLKNFYGSDLIEKHLLKGRKDLEAVQKSDIMGALNKATKNCKKKGEYSKGKHSFELLKKIDAGSVMNRCAWAKRFFDALKNQAGI